MKQVLWVALGGAIGSVLRYICQRLITSGSSDFPWGTFTVNIVGCFLIGLLWSASLKNNNFPEYMKLFLMTGICGGFTTFSAFSAESVSLLRDGKFSLFLTYSLGSMCLGFLATFAAFRLIR